MRNRYTKYTPETKTQLMDYLGDGWRTRRDIRADLGINDRVVRQIAEDTGALLMSQHGYKRTDQATADEVAENTRGLTTRAQKILARAALVERVFAGRNL